ncbi:hypothetical protein [Aquimarina aggregata]|uniref:hypothetical protein n=1 Tax=Aquimarina aggregata TaxID=1642818 RepID=UPI00248F7BDD|nr:hypothetical protein [Aquimarina aggregata]
MNKLVKGSQKTDVITTTVKIIFGTLLLVRIVKTTTELYLTIEDRKKQQDLKKQ